MTREQLRAGLDIGGTKVHAVAIDALGEIVAELRRPTGFGTDAVLASAKAAVVELARFAGVQPQDFDSVGVGIPGSVDAEAGRVANAVNLGVAALSLGPELAAEFGVAVRVENDVNAAALGAWHLVGFGAPLTAVAGRSMAYLNLGTGMAAGIVLNGVLWPGSHGTAGEIGHIPVDPNGVICSCGQRGCLETLASGSAVARQWPSRHPLPVLELFEAAEQGDALAIEVRDRLITGTAVAVRFLILTFDVDAVVIGGGVSSLGMPLLSRVRTTLDEWAADSAFLAALDLSGRVVLVPEGSAVAALGAALAGDPHRLSRAAGVL